MVNLRARLHNYASRWVYPVRGYGANFQHLFLQLLHFQGYLAGMAYTKSDSINRESGFFCFLWISLAVILTLAFWTPRVANAQTSATCRSLQAQLASVETGRGAGNSAQYEKYDRALKGQQSQIRKTERAATLNGCKLFRSNLCNRINSSLEQMYANMEKLRRTRDKLASSGGSRLDRDKILRAMAENGCSADRQANDTPADDKRRTLLEQIFGNKVYTDEGASSVSNPDLKNQFGTFRTLCVRTCDGYYFPISFSTSKERFEADQEQCQQMCPGSETALFYHPMPDGDAETAISYRSGESYSQLPAAFAYRKGVNNECSCRFATKPDGFQEIAGTTSTDQEKAESQERQFPVPVFRQDRAIDMETAENLRGGLTVEKLIAVISKSESDIPGKKDIRIVGPEFFPVQ